MFVIAVLESNTMVLCYQCDIQSDEGVKTKNGLYILNIHYRRSKQSLYPSLV